MKLRHYIFAIIILSLLVLFRFVTRVGDDRQDIFTVLRVIDGDTVELTGRETLRLLGIDTPERGEPYYDSAKIFLAEMVLGREVRVALGDRRRDNYGRLLGYIYLDTMLVNADILRHGYGWLYLFPDNRGEDTVEQKLLMAQRVAMADTVGVWRLPVFMPETYYVGNRNSLRFHRPECSSAERMAESNRIIFDSREAALYEGYAPCRNCQP